MRARHSHKPFVMSDNADHQEYKAMPITLNPEIEEIIEEKLAALKRDLQTGLDDIRHGRFTTASTDEELDNLAAEIISQRQYGGSQLCE